MQGSHYNQLLGCSSVMLHENIAITKLVRSLLIFAWCHAGHAKPLRFPLEISGLSRS